MKIEIETTNQYDIKILQNNYDKINDLIKKDHSDNRSHVISEFEIEMNDLDKDYNSIYIQRPIKKIKMEYINGYSNNGISNSFNIGFYSQLLVGCRPLFNFNTHELIHHSKLYNIKKLSDLYKLFLIDDYHHYDIKYSSIGIRYNNNFNLESLIKLDLLDFKL